MGVQTYGDLWRQVQLHAPAVPASLAQAWVQQAYNELGGKRHWAWLIQDALITTQASRSLSVGFTVGSTTITSAAGFVAGDAGRQIRSAGGNQPVYTITSVTNASTAVLTDAYGGSSGTSTATIQDIYLPMPADFRAIYDVTDFSIQRPIAWWISRERLDLFDPGRVSSDTRFRVLASYKLATDAVYSGRVLYEAWPYPTAAGSYRLTYFKRQDTLGDDDTFKGVLATKTEAIFEGAMARCARWPGTSSQKNPYFNLALSRMHEENFIQQTQDLNIMDDDQYLQDLQQVDLSKFGLAALSADTTLMRQSDATMRDYY